MCLRNKKVFYMLSFIACILFTYILWLWSRPVEIVAIHQNGNHTYIIVKNFPITDKGQVDWWLRNRDILKKRYNIPKPALSGDYTVIFWDYGDGYKEEGKYDRLCFGDLEPPKNCIDKNMILNVNYSKNYGASYITVKNSYYTDKNGHIVENKDD